MLMLMDIIRGIVEDVMLRLKLNLVACLSVESRAVLKVAPLALMMLLLVLVLMLMLMLMLVDADVEQFYMFE